MKPKYAIRFLLPTIFLICLFSSCNNSTNSIGIYVSHSDPQIDFSIEEIKNSCTLKGLGEVSLSSESKAKILFILDNEDANLKDEGYQITKQDGRIRITARTIAGAMYGGLELAEQIKLYGWDGVQNVTQNPYMEMRGTKFNIPLDVRTPSYSDPSDAAQNNIPEMWSFDFWKEYIDNMARYRYNFISLWSLQPFPSLVVTPDYEDIALDNVERSKGIWNEYYDLNGTGFDAPEIMEKTEVLKEMTIEQKIEFWQKVMAYGKSRNVDFYIVTWNIFTYGIQGKQGISNKLDNKTTQDYYKKSVAQIFRTYPDLKGIGLTTGENMRANNGGRAKSEVKEEWAYNTYALGTLEAAKEMPDREFTFLHRQHMTGALDIAKKFQPVIDQKNVEFLFSFKYAKAHVYSSIKQPYHEKFVNEIKGMKTIWTLRNDDIYYFRWGAPNYVREFIQNIPYDVSRGYYYGSDQYVWGREFLTKNAEEPRQIEVVKHWYHWMLWGRLGYNPELSNQRFTDIIQSKFPSVDASKLFTAWQEASMVYPVTTGFHWGSLDFQWYIEGCKSAVKQSDRPSGFHGVDKFIQLPPHVYSGYQSIPDFVKMTQQQDSTTLKTPLQVAQMLHQHSQKAIDLLAEMQTDKEDGELNITLNDIHTIATMGKYYAHKIAGSTYVALYRETKKKSYQEQAVIELEEALEYWKKYTKLAITNYKNPLWTNRVGYVDWVKNIADAEKDLAIAKNLHK